MFLLELTEYFCRQRYAFYGTESWEWTFCFQDERILLCKMRNSMRNVFPVVTHIILGINYIKTNIPNSTPLLSRRYPTNFDKVI